MPALTQEQQDLRKDALTLKRLFPAYRPEHTVADGFLALLAQIEASQGGLLGDAKPAETRIDTGFEGGLLPAFVAVGEPQP